MSFKFEKHIYGQQMDSTPCIYIYMWGVTIIKEEVSNLKGSGGHRRGQKGEE